VFVAKQIPHIAPDVGKLLGSSNISQSAKISDKSERFKKRVTKIITKLKFSFLLWKSLRAYPSGR
jgi:hypothetical protein